MEKKKYNLNLFEPEDIILLAQHSDKVKLENEQITITNPDKEAKKAINEVLSSKKLKLNLYLFEPEKKELIIKKA